MPDKKTLTRNLIAFLMEHVADYKSHFEVSDVKQDGTVFVRFRSAHGYGATAMDLAMRFSDALNDRGMDFVQTDDNKFRLPLVQFRVKAASDQE